MISSLLPITVTILAGGPATSVAQESRADLEIAKLDAPAGERSSLPYLFTGADGRVHLTWAERRAKRTAAILYATLDGAAWSAPEEITLGKDLFLNWADFPSLCVLESGTLVAQWLRRGTSAHAYDAEFSISVDGGKTWSAPRRLHTDTSAVEHGFVSLVPIDGETCGAIWLDGRAIEGRANGEGAMALYFRTIGRAGKLGEETLLDPWVCSCCQTSLEKTIEGGLLATYRDRSEGEVRDVSMVRFDGSRWSEPVSIREDGWVIAGCPVNGPQLAARGATTAVAWFTGAGDDEGEVFVAFDDPVTNALGTAIDVDDGRPAGRVDVVALGDESVVVSWLELTENGGAEWRARRVWSDGRVDASVLVAEVAAERSSGFLRMCSAQDGIVLAWTSADTGQRVETARLRPKP